MVLHQCRTLPLLHHRCPPPDLNCAVALIIISIFFFASLRSSSFLRRRLIIVLHRCANHLLRAVALIIIIIFFFAPLRSSSSSLHRPGCVLIRINLTLSSLGVFRSLHRCARHLLCAAVLIIFIVAPVARSSSFAHRASPRESSLSHPARPHFTLTLTSFSLPAAEVALIVAPSRSVDCCVFEVAVVVAPSRSRAQLMSRCQGCTLNSLSRRRGCAIPLLSHHCRDISFKSRRRGRALRFKSRHEIARSVSSRAVEGAHSIYCSAAVKAANSVALPASAPIFASHRCALSFMRRRGAQTPF